MKTNFSLPYLPCNCVQQLARPLFVSLNHFEKGVVESIQLITNLGMSIFRLLSFPSAIFVLHRHKALKWSYFKQLLQAPLYARQVAQAIVLLAAEPIYGVKIDRIKETGFYADKIARFMIDYSSKSNPEDSNSSVHVTAIPALFNCLLAAPESVEKISSFVKNDQRFNLDSLLFLPEYSREIAEGSLASKTQEARLYRKQLEYVLKAFNSPYFKPKTIHDVLSLLRKEEMLTHSALNYLIQGIDSIDQLEIFLQIPRDYREPSVIVKQLALFLKNPKDAEASFLAISAFSKLVSNENDLIPLLNTPLKIAPIVESFKRLLEKFQYPFSTCRQHLGSDSFLKFFKEVATYDPSSSKFSLTLPPSIAPKDREETDHDQLFTQCFFLSLRLKDPNPDSLQYLGTLMRELPLPLSLKIMSALKTDLSNFDALVNAFYRLYLEEILTENEVELLIRFPKDCELLTKLFLRVRFLNEQMFNLYASVVSDNLLLLAYLVEWFTSVYTYNQATQKALDWIFDQQNLKNWLIQLKERGSPHDPFFEVLRRQPQKEIILDKLLSLIKDPSSNDYQENYVVFDGNIGEESEEDDESVDC